MSKNHTFIINAYNYYEYTLKDKSLEVYHWNFFQGGNRYTINLNDIEYHYETKYQSIWRPNYLGIYFLIIIYAILELRLAELAFILLLILGLLLLVKSKVIILHAKPKPLVFSCWSTSPEQIESFIEEIIQSSKNYFRWKYGQADKDLPFEKQIQNYKWLRDIEVIDDEEYLELKQNLKAIFDQKKPEA